MRVLRLPRNEAPGGTSRPARAVSRAFLALLLIPPPGSGEDRRDRIDFKYMYYQDRNGVVNHTPAFDWHAFFLRDWSFQWSQEFDVVSGASRRLGAGNIGRLGDNGVDAASGASRRSAGQQPFANPWKDSAFDAVSGASRRELRTSENPSLTYSRGGNEATGGLYYSSEPDYTSFSPSLSYSRDFFERNTTLGAAGAWFFDDFKPRGAFRGRGGSKQVRSLTLTVNQILSPLSMASLTATDIYANGYLGHPYNPVLLDSGLMIEERVPNDKTSWALAAQWVQGFRLGGSLGSLHLQYRHYMDSWDLAADDVDVQWYQHVGEGAYFRLRARIRAGARGVIQGSVCGERGLSFRGPPLCALQVAVIGGQVLVPAARGLAGRSLPAGPFRHQLRFRNPGYARRSRHQSALRALPALPAFALLHRRHPDAGAGVRSLEGVMRFFA